jgi:hypothetical protein
MAKLLRVLTTIIGAVATLTGLAGVALGQSSPLFAPVTGEHVVLLDNMIRFYAAIWLGLGLAALWVSARIDAEPALFRTVWALILLGGIGRVVSVAMAGSPGPILLAVMGSELSSLVILVLHHRLRAAPAAA